MLGDEREAGPGAHVHPPVEGERGFNKRCPSATALQWKCPANPQSLVHSQVAGEPKRELCSLVLHVPDAVKAGRVTLIFMSYVIMSDRLLL